MHQDNSSWLLNYPLLDIPLALHSGHRRTYLLHFPPVSIHRHVYIPRLVASYPIIADELIVHLPPTFPIRLYQLPFRSIDHQYLIYWRERAHDYLCAIVSKLDCRHKEDSFPRVVDVFRPLEESSWSVKQKQAFLIGGKGD